MVNSISVMRPELVPEWSPRNLPLTPDNVSYGSNMMGIESCGMLISAVHHEEGEEKLHLLMLDDHIPAGAKMY